jgi:hypothetical protein
VGSLFAFSFNLLNPTSGQDAPTISVTVTYGTQVITHKMGFSPGCAQLVDIWALAHVLG